VRHRSDDEDRLLSDDPLDGLSAVPKGPDGNGTRRRLVPFQLPPKTIDLNVGEAVRGLLLSELSRFEHQVLSVLRPFRKRLATRRCRKIEKVARYSGKRWTNLSAVPNRNRDDPVLGLVVGGARTCFETHRRRKSNSIIGHHRFRRHPSIPREEREKSGESQGETVPSSDTRDGQQRHQGTQGTQRIVSSGHQEVRRRKL
jgi:hypothetical protein